MTSRLILACLVAVAMSVAPVAHGWGGLFNRFSPEMLANLGYGGGVSQYRQQPYMQVSSIHLLNTYTD